MALYRKKSLVDAELIIENNFENLKRLGASIQQYNERSLDAWHEYGKVGEAVIWTEYNKIMFAQCKTIEGLHTAELPSMLMKGEIGELYFCTKEIFDKTYERVFSDETIEALKSVKLDDGTKPPCAFRYEY